MKLITICLLLSLGYSGRTQPSIVGTWKFDISASLQHDQLVKSKYDSLPSLSRSRISELFDSRMFEFDAGGNVKIAWQQNNIEKNIIGTYSFGGGTTELMIDISNRTTRFNVLSLTESDLVLEDPMAGGLFGIIFLKKQNN